MKELNITFDTADKLSSFMEEVDKKGDFFYTFDFNQPKDVKFYQLSDESFTMLKSIAARHKGSRDHVSKRSLRRKDRGNQRSSLA
jgi:hypothetical protein